MQIGGIIVAIIQANQEVLLVLRKKAFSKEGFCAEESLFSTKNVCFQGNINFSFPVGKKQNILLLF